ncbi:hypothetical protein PEX1_091120 [Penicillium expansum]|uniref:Uncharacterized protein n=1 Tax=Penicillium expansum TaxID=27334 RepID=A0A0A2IKS0_PENEN|nr:hypothetical protein PEX2_016200 [Penicillium expansum]KGO40850.1 hypothetical protein PEXP_086550 [Penicillium expansum]KGO61715.1 hypothetical protein PEX2_016200 [Penicillium expansum]KGO68215.1 hypothetical protein PEX1_091120 [Penicillium expansum]UPX44912.1 hypothetical protein FAC10E3_02 [Penicillium camemberti]
MSPTLLQASAAAFALLSVGHTIKGRQWTADPRFKAIAGTNSWTCGTLGWYQGSGFFLLTGLLHWQWSRDPSLLQDPLSKAMAGIVNILLWASSVWYIKHGINDTAIVLAISATLQAFGVGKACL